MLVSGPAGPKDKSGVWILSLVSGELHKLIDDAAGGAVLSPDESRILFRRISAPEVWIMKANGEEPRKVLSVPLESAHDARLAWFPDGRRIAIASANRVGDEFTITSYDLDSMRSSVILSDPKGGDFSLARDGRIIYTRLESAPNDKSANLWEVRLDTRTGRILSSPRRLTQWAGFLFGSLGSSADGRRLFFIRLQYRNNVYVGDLEENGARLTSPRRFSFEQWTNWPTGWTRDSQAVFFNSDRDGKTNIFQQPIGGAGSVDALVRSEDEKMDARSSADGRWILYLAWPRIQGKVQTSGGRLMRTGVRGQPAQMVFPVAGYASHLRLDPLVSISAEGHPAFRCPAVSQAACVLSEEIGDQVVFTAFDPVAGRRGEVTRIPASRFSFWDLSPDGRWIALGKNEETSGHIRLISLAGEAPRETSAGEWTHLLSAAWVYDGKGLFVTAFASKGAPLLHVSLDGAVTLLHRGLKYVENPVASPDGKHLAFGEMTEEGNAWVLDMPRQ